MSDIRKMINPHDEITIDCTDIDAARIAVLVVGHGSYAIENDAMPFLVFTVDGPEKWFMQTYGMSMSAFVESVSRERVAAAMESMALVGYRTSESDPVGKAHRIAAGIRAKNTPAPEPGTESENRGFEIAFKGAVDAWKGDIAKAAFYLRHVTGTSGESEAHYWPKDCEVCIEIAAFLKDADELMPAPATGEGRTE